MEMTLVICFIFHWQILMLILKHQNLRLGQDLSNCGQILPKPGKNMLKSNSSYEDDYDGT